VAPHLIVLSGLAGAFVLAVGVVAGYLLRGAPTAGGVVPAPATIRELLHDRKARQRQIETATSALAGVLEDPSMPRHTRLQLEAVQRCLIDRYE
jgi:uncharacterized protein (DUF2342 family)